MATYELSATMNEDYEKYKYRPFQKTEREMEDYLYKQFNPKTYYAVCRVRIIKGNTLLMCADLPPNIKYCQYWIEDLKESGFDFEAYDFEIGRLLEDFTRVWEGRKYKYNVNDIRGETLVIEEGGHH